MNKFEERQIMCTVAAKGDCPLSRAKGREYFGGNYSQIETDKNGIYSCVELGGNEGCLEIERLNQSITIISELNRILGEK
jgi:hypothetical protein